MVHLFGFITKKFVTMYGHMNIKKIKIYTCGDSGMKLPKCDDSGLKTGKYGDGETEISKWDDNGIKWNKVI